MGRMPLADSSGILLHTVARDSIRHGLVHNHPPALNLQTFPAELLAERATFVTLRLNGKLRGCIGTLDASRPLAEDANQNAFSAAFRDTRFHPLAPEEESNVSIHISILEPPQAFSCESEPELLSRLRPGVDGLILRDGARRATFLPSVWKELPDPRDFLTQLRLKAGLTKNHWSATIRFWRYETEEI